MGWMDLLGGLISLAQLYFKAKAEGKAERFTLALDRITQLEKATADELAKAVKARDDARDNPNAGRM